MLNTIILLPVFIFCFFLFSADQAQSSDWGKIMQKARGQTVYFNGWGGSDPINDYIRWAGDQAKKRYQVEVKHVKVSDIGAVVSRILAEKSGGREHGGSVDLMWITGENFNTMKHNNLLQPPYSQQLPHLSLVDTENKKSTLYDFTVPVDNMEVPWGMAQLVFLYDQEHIKTHPRNMEELLSFAKSHPGRVSYPLPPNFHGTTFLKQALIELTPDRKQLSRPVSESDFDLVTAPLWEYLDKLHPHMWRKGTSFPANGSEMKRLLNDGELFIAISFNPAEASNGIATGELPESIRTYVHDSGTIGNSHFVAIPFNASAKEGSLVFANFLLSPEAQARKSDPAIWGDPTVLAMDKLSPEEKNMFQSIPQGVATLSPEALGTVLLEPHASWVEALEKGWLKRYSR
jgi:putative thiamine transport system substrate-binding protein